MTAFVAIGPTLPAAALRRVLPQARAIPPVAAGDLLALDARKGDVVGIVDGYFRQQSAVRHKEILWLLDRGVRVVGASSMGALRAAELEPFGMEGVGRIFDQYARGAIDGDDEVAVLHGPAPDYVPLTIALVNLRAGIERAVSTALLSAAAGDAVVAAAKALPFTRRTAEHIADGVADEPSLSGDRLERRDLVRRLVFDQKRADADELLRTLSDALPRRRPSRAVALNLSTSNFARLRRSAVPGAVVNGEAVSDEQILDACRVLDPSFPSVLRRTCLETLAGVDADREDRAEAAVLRQLRRRGLIEDETALPARLLCWVAPEERDEPVRSQLVNAVVRAFFSVQSIPRIIDNLKECGAYDRAAPRAAAAASLVREVAARRPELDVEETSLEALLDWTAGRWGVSRAALPWALLDRGFYRQAALPRAAAPHHLVDFLTSHRGAL